MKLNNENETYTIHFMFHTNSLHNKSSRIPVMENNVNITYQLMVRQKITQDIIHDYLSKRIY